jgi:glycosyltransferase involved in cell wall biosynthesis
LKDDSTPRGPLRVAHLMQYFAIGGLERMVEHLSVGAQSRGIESLVIGYLGNGPIRTSLEKQGVRTVLLEGRAGLHPRLVVQLHALLRRERIDVLHTHHLGPFVYGAPAAALVGCGHVHTEHSHELYDTTRRRLLGALMPAFAEVVAVSPEVSKYRERFRGRCRVIQNGVPLPVINDSARVRARTILGADEDSFVVGCAARLSVEKDHAGLLDAFARLHESEPRAILACAGAGPLADALRSQSRAMGLESQVRWLGAVDDMQSFYSALDVCALNSVREGLPLSLLEAMSFGIPVVATDVGGVGELLADGAGLTVPPRAPALLAEALRSVAADPSLAQALGRKGQARVRRNYSVDHMVDQYVQLYSEVAKRALPPADAECSACA